MRSIRRAPLDAALESNLRARQAAIDAALANGVPPSKSSWNTARQSTQILAILGVLHDMAGTPQRCMYCLDSHGTDIEHFWPKARYPERMFVWLNFLLCCSECGRIKGDKFPLIDTEPLLLDPTVDDPWAHLHFDPETGNLVAMWDVATSNYSAKGRATVETFRLDRREALAVQYQRTHGRLSAVVQKQLEDSAFNGDSLAEALRSVDDHGLLGWCFLGTGQRSPPFAQLKHSQPDTWDACFTALRSALVHSD